MDEDESWSGQSVTVLVNRGWILIVSSIINYRCRSSNTTPAIHKKQTNKQTNSAWHNFFCKVNNLTKYINSKTKKILELFVFLLFALQLRKLLSVRFWKVFVKNHPLGPYGSLWKQCTSCRMAFLKKNFELPTINVTKIRCTLAQGVYLGDQRGL